MTKKSGFFVSDAGLKPTAATKSTEELKPPAEISTKKTERKEVDIDNLRGLGGDPKGFV